VLEVLQEVRVGGQREQGVVARGVLAVLNLQERDKRDAVAEPGRGVPHAGKLRLPEFLDDLLNGCLSVGDVFLVELGPNHQYVH
jgi:hypothetical protein